MRDDDRDSSYLQMHNVVPAVNVLGLSADEICWSGEVCFSEFSDGVQMMCLDLAKTGLGLLKLLQTCCQKTSKYLFISVRMLVWVVTVFGC